MNRHLRLSILLCGLAASVYLLSTALVHYTTGEFVEGGLAQSRPRASDARLACPDSNDACMRVSEYARHLRDQLRQAEDDVVLRSYTQASERFYLAVGLAVLFLAGYFVVPTRGSSQQ